MEPLTYNWEVGGGGKKGAEEGCSFVYVCWGMGGYPLKLMVLILLTLSDYIHMYFMYTSILPPTDLTMAG